VLFADYVRMVRSHKGVDWTRHLEPVDLEYVSSRVDLDGWYPMTTFERLGNAILKEIAGGEVESARFWGRASVHHLNLLSSKLVVDGDPLDTLMRFKVLRSTYFDFEALIVREATVGHARIEIQYFMGPMAEEAASWQTLGFFEQLLTVAGAEGVEARWIERSWAGDERTVMTLDWH
jgi:hypothetical protein